ncbi:MAG: CRISPR-associated protein Cas5 [Bacteroidota bacterium]
MNRKAISVDFRARFGFFKKQDTNEGICFTYNCIHKPALLGILGAICGLGGHSEAFYRRQKSDEPELPDFYNKLKDIPLGVRPISRKRNLEFKGIFQKTVIYYVNTTGFANKQATLQLKEQTLIDPAFRIYMLLDLDDELQSKLYHSLKNAEADYLPYMGKNDFQVWWDESDVREYDYEEFTASGGFRIANMFAKESVMSATTEIDWASEDFEEDIGEACFMTFEHLPVGYNMEAMTYDKLNFVMTDKKFGEDDQFADLYKFTNSDIKQIIQLK